jgi:hypothetical protein
MNRTSRKPIEKNDLQLLLIICKVTLKWETAKACFFRNKTWKFRHRELCPVSNLCHYPLNQSGFSPDPLGVTRVEVILSLLPFFVSYCKLKLTSYPSLWMDLAAYCTVYPKLMHSKSDLNSRGSRYSLILNAPEFNLGHAHMTPTRPHTPTSIQPRLSNLITDPHYTSTCTLVHKDAQKTCWSESKPTGCQILQW